MYTMPSSRNKLVSSSNSYRSKFGYLMKIYAVMFFNALKQSHVSREDFLALMFMIIGPVFYVLDVRIIKSPFGTLHIADRETLRSFLYGFFKTHFYYVKDLQNLLGELRFSAIVDVGANIGDFTLGTRKLVDKIIVVEPGKQNFRALNANLNANFIDNVFTVNVAATDTEKTVFLQGNTSDMFVSAQEKGEAIRGLTIDHIVQSHNIDSVDVVKLDVQGHELPALVGMSRLLLRKSVKLLIVEVHLKRGVRSNDVVYIMNKYGYKLIHRDNYLFEQPHLYFMSGN
jgi:FkbM family methyltransferase